MQDGQERAARANNFLNARREVATAKPLSENAREKFITAANRETGGPPPDKDARRPVEHNRKDKMSGSRSIRIRASLRGGLPDLRVEGFFIGQPPRRGAFPEYQQYRGTPKKGRQKHSQVH